MIEVGKCILSRSVFEEHFFCDLNACKGQCCVEGESGAPLTDEECSILESLLPDLEDVLRPESLAAIREQGAWVTDFEGDRVTTLVAGAECAYAVFKADGTALCGIEVLFSSGNTQFQKPLSCHLYPIRIDHHKHFDALNFHRWQVCDVSRAKWMGEGTPVFRYIKDALIRCYGHEWYDELETIYELHFAATGGAS